MSVKSLKEIVKSYSYRFLPFVAINWKKRQVKQISLANDNDIISTTGGEAELQDLFNCFHQKQSSIDAKSKQRRNGITLEAASKINKKVLLERNGFSLVKQKSCISEAGDGIFVVDGRIAKHSIAALYPGTVYVPMEPLLFQSIRNQYILRCIDGILIDGSSKGMSRSIFRSCAARDVLGPYRLCDDTWLTDTPLNPLAVGQYVNNGSSSHPANVVYQEIDLSVSFPLMLRQYIPNVRYKTIDYDNTPDQVLIRLVALVAIKDISKGEELFASYFTEVSG